MGIIYLLTSPSDKVYIGQTIDTLDNRWRDHLYDAYDPKKDHCVALNNAIRKYGNDTFTRKIILTCDDNMLDHYETTYIKLYKSRNPKFGYNIKEGGANGKHADITKKKISDSLKGRDVKISTRQKLSLTTKKNKELPMYIIEFKYNGKVVGYRVCNHPNGLEKKITDSSLTMGEKLLKAKDYLKYLENLEEPIKPTLRKLPKYLQKYRDGYCVKHPKTKTKYFVSSSLSQSAKLDLAMKYLESCS